MMVRPNPNWRMSVPMFSIIRKDTTAMIDETHVNLQYSKVVIESTDEVRGVP